MSNETMTKPAAEATKPKRTNEEKLQELYAKRDKLLKRLADVKETEFGRKLLASTVSDQCKKLDENIHSIYQLNKKISDQENTIDRLNKQLSIMTEKYHTAEKQIAELAEEKRQAEEQLAEMQSADKSNATKQNNIFKHIFGQDKR
ncbi:MAG: hypothetical protein MSA82_03305 [Oscillospiraceae bacterium]|nr:hypothetical protein [Oscillospiraceae bacterium]